MTSARTLLVDDTPRSATLHPRPLRVVSVSLLRAVMPRSIRAHSVPCNDAFNHRPADDLSQLLFWHLPALCLSAPDDILHRQEQRRSEILGRHILCVLRGLFVRFCG